MRRWWMVLVALGVVGCAAPDVSKLKAKQVDRSKAGASGVKDQTGVDLGTATPAPGKKKLPLGGTNPDDYK